MQDVPPDVEARIRKHDIVEQLDHDKIRVNVEDGRSNVLNLPWKDLYTDENTKQQKNEKGFDESGIIVVAAAILRRTVYSRRVAHLVQ